MVAIFYMLFLLKIYLDRPHNLLGLAAEPIAVFAITAILRIVIDRKRPSEKYDLTPIDGSKKKMCIRDSIYIPQMVFSIFCMPPNYLQIAHLLCIPH